MQSIMLLSALGFKRKEFRGKLAIAITANFVNRNTTAEAKVEEISGVAFIFNQKFFLELKEEAGVVKLLHDGNKIWLHSLNTMICSLMFLKYKLHNTNLNTLLASVSVCNGSTP